MLVRGVANDTGRGCNENCSSWKPQILIVGRQKQHKKLIGAYSLGISEAADEDELMQGNALIRANFGIDPSALDEERWAMIFSEAVWIENYRLKNLAKILAALYGEKLL